MFKKSIISFLILIIFVLNFSFPKNALAAIGDDTGVSFSTYAGVTIAQGNGVTSDGTYFYVVDSLTDKVYKFDSNMTYTGTSFDIDENGNDARGITYYNGFLWIIDDTNDEVYKYQTDGTNTGFSFDTAGSGNGTPRGITAYNDFFWITDIIDDEVYKYNSDGTYTTVHFDTAVNLNTNPFGIVAYNDFFWITDTGTDEVYKYNPDGSYASVSFDTAANGVNDPNNITAYNDFLWIVDSGVDGVYKYQSTGTFVSSFPFTGNLFPQGISSGGGFFWIADYAKDKVYKYNLDGTYTGIHFSTAASGATNIRDVLYYDGYLWLPESSDDGVYKYQTDGTYVSFFDTFSAGGGGPLGMTYYDGYFWILDTTDPSILKFNTDGTYAGTEFDLSFMWGDFPDFNPEGIIYDNGFFWIADYTDKEIFAFNLDGTYTNFSFDTAISGNTATNGITSYNDFFWITGDANTSVYKFEGGILDVTNPSVSTFFPSDNSTEANKNSNLEITFDEDVDVGTGNITIKKTSDNSTFATIDVTSELVTGTGTGVIIINPSVDFTQGQEYYVQIDATAFDDTAGNSYAGIADTTTWNFSIPMPHSSSGSSRKVVSSKPEVPVIIPVPNTPNLATECLPEHKFSNITGLPCPITVEVNTPNVPQSEDLNKFIFTKSLWVKMIDPEVKELQKYLNTHGFPVALTGAGSLGNETTKFGNLTRDALIKFQQSKGITPAIGFFGPITRGVINGS